MRPGLRVTALVAVGMLVVFVTVAMLLLPPASPRRLVAGLLESGDPSFYAAGSDTPPAGLPVFVAQGGTDTLVVPTATQGYVASACQGGGRMTFRDYPTKTHGTIADAALPDVMAFLAASVAGTPPP